MGGKNPTRKDRVWAPGGCSNLPEQELGGDAVVCAGRRGTGGGAAETGLQEILLQRGVGLLRGGEIPRLERLAELVEESGHVVLLAGLAGTAMMMVVMRVSGALLARLLQVLLDGGEVGLRGVDIAGLQILSELRNGGSEGTAALRAGSGGDSRVLLCTGKKLLEGC